MERLQKMFSSLWHWLRVNPGSLPSVFALVTVAVFWTVGLVGGLSLLHEHQPPLATLMGLYFMLALVAISITLAVLAASDLARRVPAPKKNFRRVP